MNTLSTIGSSNSSLIWIDFFATINGVSFSLCLNGYFLLQILNNKDTNNTHKYITYPNLFQFL